MGLKRFLSPQSSAFSDSNAPFNGSRHPFSVPPTMSPSPTPSAAPSGLPPSPPSPSPHPKRPSLGARYRSSITRARERPLVEPQTDRAETGGTLFWDEILDNGTNVLANSSEGCLFPSEIHPSPTIIVFFLRSVLQLDKEKVTDCLQVDELVRQYQTDLAAKSGRGNVLTPGAQLGVFNEPLRRVSIYASSKGVLAGREHELPTVVVSCVEELYRTGIYQPNLFRTLPNRSRLADLINIFDSENLPTEIEHHTRPHTPRVRRSFGGTTSLHLESTADICALLSTYISSLPEPLVPPRIFKAIWTWCDVGSDAETQDGQVERSSSSVSLSNIYNKPQEARNILVAQLLLHLLPTANFSLIVYLLEFFSQITVAREENGAGIGDMASMFGRQLFGGYTPTEGQTSVAAPKGTPPPGTVMMAWFLRRCNPILDGIFTVLDDFKDEMTEPRSKSHEQAVPSPQKPAERPNTTPPHAHTPTPSDRTLSEAERGSRIHPLRVSSLKELNDYPGPIVHSPPPPRPPPNTPRAGHPSTRRRGRFAEPEIRAALDPDYVILETENVREDMDQGPLQPAVHESTKGNLANEPGPQGDHQSIETRRLLDSATNELSALRLKCAQFEDRIALLERLVPCAVESLAYIR